MNSVEARYCMNEMEGAEKVTRNGFCGGVNVAGEVPEFLRFGDESRRRCVALL